MSSEAADAAPFALVVSLLFSLSTSFGLQEVFRSSSSNRHVKVILFAILIRILTAPSSAQHVEFDRRVASFRGSPRQLAADDAALVRLADSGFFLKADGQQVCFCCGLSSDQVQLHQSCAHQQLLSFLDGAPDGGRIGSQKPWPSRQVDILCQFLKGPVTALVESFGFARNLVTFAAVKQFAGNSWRLPESPGELVQLVHSLDESPLVRIASKVNLESLVTHLAGDGPTGRSDCSAPIGQFDGAAVATSSLFSAAAPRFHELASRAAADGATSTIGEESGRPRSEAVSDRCTVCQRRPRSRVTLPCSHFSACAECLQSCAVCPVCSSRIIATIVAYIS